MKKLLCKVLIVVALCNFTKVANAQNTLIKYDNKDLEKFLTCTMKVALVGDEKYDSAIKKAMEQYWTLTKVEYFNYTDMVKKKMYDDKTSSFLLPLVYTYMDNNFEAREIRVWNFAGTDLWLTIFMGGGGSIANLTDYNVIAYAPIDNFANEIHMFNCSYRLGLMVKGMQDAITILRDKSFKEAPLYIMRDVMAEMSKKAGVLKSKTLLVNENLIKTKNFKDKFSLTEDVLKAYQFKYKITSQAEIETAIKNKDKEYCYFCPVFSSNKNIYVNDLETGEAIFAINERKGLAVTKEDIAKLNAAVNSSK